MTEYCLYYNFYVEWAIKLYKVDIFEMLPNSNACKDRVSNFKFFFYYKCEYVLENQGYFLTCC